MAYHLPHLRVEAFQAGTSYRPRQYDMSEVRSRRDHKIHAPRLQQEVAAALTDAHALLTLRDPEIHAGNPGVYLEVTGEAGRQLADLDWISKGIVLGARRVSEAGIEVGAWFIPTDSETFLRAKIDEYRRDAAKEKPRHE